MVLRKRIAAWLRGRPDPLDPEVSLAACTQSGFPHPFPDGWYVLLRSGDLGDKPRSVDALGRSFVLFRDQVGEVTILDAHCPHLGADLSQGRVCAGRLVCPFHGWAFDADGNIKDIPYSRTRPLRGARRWHSVERYGLIFVYFSETVTRRFAAPTPRFPAPTLPERDRLPKRWAHDAAAVKMHLVEFAENSVDASHFGQLHARMRVPIVGLPVPGVRLHHHTTWRTDAHDWSVSWFENTVQLEALGQRWPAATGHASICMMGPGSVVRFRITLPEAGSITFLQTHTPIAPLLLKTRFTAFADPAVPGILVRYIMLNWLSQWREDVRIWENKVYRPDALLVPEDGPLYALRKWFAQFYPEPSLLASAASRRKVS